MQNNQPRRKGFSFLSFLLGVLLGIILLAGSIVGVVVYALSANVDDVLAMAGLDNGKDDEGKNRYINSDKENGGVETLLELVQKVAAMTSNTGNLSLGEFENLLPAVSGVVDGLHGALSAYVEIDRGEFAGVKFSQIGEFMQDKILEVQPAALFENLGMGGMLDNKIMELVFCGAEAEYVVDEAGGEKYPAYYDVYEQSAENGKFLRKGDGAELSAGYIGNLADRHGEKRLYYYFIGGTPYVTDGDFTYVPPARSVNGAVYSLYSAEYSKFSGNYYYAGEEKVNVSPVTLRTLSDGGFAALDEVYLTELLEGDDALAEKVLGNVSLGDIMKGTVDFNEVLDGLLLSDLMEVNPADKIMARLIYNLCDVKPAFGQSYAYTAVYKKDGEETPCYIEAKGSNVISRVYCLDGANQREITSISVGELQNGLDIGSLKIGEILDVEGNMLLENLADSTIDGLPQAIQNLTINEVYYKEIYKIPEKYLLDADGNYVLSPDGEKVVDTPAVEATLKKAVALNPAVGEIIFSEEYIYYAKDQKGKTTLVNENAEKPGKLTQAQFVAGVALGTQYYTYGEAQGMWKILLYMTAKDAVTDSDGNVLSPRETTEGAYSLDKLTDMISNVSNNISGTTLYDLHDNGILVFKKRSDLNATVSYNGKHKLGELELTEALSYLVNVLNNPNVQHILGMM